MLSVCWHFRRENAVCCQVYEKRFSKPFLSCQVYEKMVQWTIFEWNSEVSRMREVSNYKTAGRFLGMVLAAVILILCRMMPIDGLSKQAMGTLGVLGATLCLLIFESFNICVSCLLSSAMLFAFGCVDSLGAAFSGYSNHVLYFTIASFGISLAFQKSVISRKLLGGIIRSDKLGTKAVTFIFMVCAAALSAIMSNVAAVVIFMPYAEGYLECYRDKESRVRSRRSMMMCMVVAAMIGGMITPAGSSMNLICVDMLERYAGYRVRFVDWVAAGLPLAVIMLVAAFIIITTVYPPAKLSEEEMKGYLQTIHEKKKMSGMDIYIGLLILGVLFTWIVSSWVPSIHITVTAIVGLALMFIPGHEVMTWEEFCSFISWPTFFVAGTLISIASAVTSTGLCDYFTGLLFPAGTGYTENLAIFQIAVFTFILMAVLPSAPAVITILSPIIIQFAMKNGFSPVVLLMTCAFCVSNIYLFPLDAPLVVAYDRKAFGMFELPRATIWIQLVMIGVVSLWMPVIYR